METLLLRCPTEVTPYISSITQAGNQFIKYDPVSNFCDCFIPLLTNEIQNYAGDDEDEEMADADDDEEDEADLDEYAYSIRLANNQLSELP